jgi:hypothetical protein
MRLVGNGYPEFLIAERIRSRLSCTAASQRPTIVQEGIPAWTSTSMSTRSATSQVRVRDWRVIIGEKVKPYQPSTNRKGKTPENGSRKLPRAWESGSIQENYDSRTHHHRSRRLNSRCRTQCNHPCSCSKSGELRPSRYSLTGFWGSR